MNYLYTICALVSQHIWAFLYSAYITKNMPNRWKPSFWMTNSQHSTALHSRCGYLRPVRAQLHKNLVTFHGHVTNASRYRGPQLWWYNNTVRAYICDSFVNPTFVSWPGLLPSLVTNTFVYDVSDNSTGQQPWPVYKRLRSKRYTAVVCWFII